LFILYFLPHLWATSPQIGPQSRKITGVRADVLGTIFRQL
jgi:hypothetical protein